MGRIATKKSLRERSSRAALSMVTGWENRVGQEYEKKVLPQACYGWFVVNVMGSRDEAPVLRSLRLDRLNGRSIPLR